MSNLEQLCADAGLTPFHTRVAVLHARGLEARQIARELMEERAGEKRKHYARRQRRLVFEVLEGLENAAAMLGKAYPEMFRAGLDFAHQLVECVANRVITDERPPGVCGVAPAREAKPVRAGRVITGDDPRLRQSPAACLRLWGQGMAAG